MRFFKALTVIGTLLAGAFGLTGPAAASPLASGAMPAAKAGGALVEKAQFYEERRVYRPDRGLRPYPVVRPYPSVRPYRVVRPYPVVRRYQVYRPAPVVRYYPAYQPRRVVRYAPTYRPVVVRRAPRTVCTTRYRTIRTAYGDYVRRPVQRCVRRY